MTHTSITTEMIEAAEEAYMPFGDMGLAIQCALAAAPQPQEATVNHSLTVEAAPVQLPDPVAYRMHDPEEPDIGNWLHEGRGMACLVHEPLYTEQQVRQLLAAHGIKVAP